MSFSVKVGRRNLRVPREIEAAGPQAIEEWIEEQTAPKKRPRRPRPKRRSTALRTSPQATTSAEAES